MIAVWSAALPTLRADPKTIRIGRARGAEVRSPADDPYSYERSYAPVLAATPLGDG
eukprot:gene12332-22244_t